MTSVSSLLSPTKGLLRIETGDEDKENYHSSSSSSSSSCGAVDQAITILGCSPLKKKDVFDMLMKKYSDRLIVSIDDPQSIRKKSSRKRRNQSLKVAHMLESIDGLKLFKTPAPATLSPVSPAFNSLRNSTELPSFQSVCTSPVYNDRREKILQTYSKYIRTFAESKLKAESILSEDNYRHNGPELLSFETSDKTILRQMVLFKEFETIKYKPSSAVKAKETTKILENYNIKDYKSFNKKSTIDSDMNIDVDDLLSEMDDHLMSTSTSTK